MREKTFNDILDRLKMTINSNIYKNNLNNPKVNWLNLPINTTIESVINYLETLETILI